MGKLILKILVVTAACVGVLAIGVGLWGRAQLTGSLPKLDGEIKSPQLTADVAIERDELGIPTIRAANRIDLAYATGFAHAQDRFFQMDLLRRNSAGELAEVVGKPVLEADQRVRVNRFRNVAQRVMAAAPQQDRAILDAYAAGVNAGLASLDKPPFEYLLLGLQPKSWIPEDSVLVLFSMFLDLQGTDYRDESKLGLMHDLLPAGMFDFVAPRGTEWDAPIVGDAFTVPFVPGPEVFNTRTQKQAMIQRLTPLAAYQPEPNFHPGSNNWAVSGQRTKDGRALLADDMHLGIRVPHVWYRASFVWPDEQGSGEQRMTGVSLPGTPAIVVGSNGHVAWGFTNSEGDWVDIVIVETDPNDPEAYQTPDGPRKFEHYPETIKVQGAEDVTLDVVSTIWGPIMDHDHRGRPRAIRWVAHDTEGVNMGLLRVESARTLEEAIELANLSGSPHQNFVVADDKGRIAWTILGRIPRRVGFDGRLPSSWADGSHKWDGYLAPAEYPKVIDPAIGRIWTANARVVSDEMLATLGDGGYDLGARAQQIREDLLDTENATEADMLRIQLDDRAVFLERWRNLLLDTLTPDAVAADAKRGELRGFVDNWGGRATIDSVGFRAVRAFRLLLIDQISDVLVTPCKEADKKFKIGHLDRVEGPVWRLVSEKPEHMLDPRFEDWNQLLLAAVDQVIKDAGEKAPRMSEYTWGRFNTTEIKHPLSQAVPALASWLDMAPRMLPGDLENMPRIQGPKAGASQRLAVSPGHEADGYCHMPCGQSGHPLSPHYRDAHDAWSEGKAVPFLPGKTLHKLVLKATGEGSAAVPTTSGQSPAEKMPPLAAEQPVEEEQPAAAESEATPEPVGAK